MPKEYKFSITTCYGFDEESFNKSCKLVEKKFPNLKKGEFLEDVDGSTLQYYYHSKGDIRVVNDYQLDCVYIESNFDLSSYIRKKS